MKSKNIVQLPVICNKSVKKAGVLFRLIVGKSDNRIEYVLIKVEDKEDVYILPFNSIMSIQAEAIFILNKEDMINIRDYAVANQLLENEIQLEGRTIYNSDGKSTGKIEDFIFDMQTGIVESLVCVDEDGKGEFEIPFHSFKEIGKNIVYTKRMSEYFPDIFKQQIGLIRSDLEEIKKMLNQVLKNQPDDSLKDMEQIHTESHNVENVDGTSQIPDDSMTDLYKMQDEKLNNVIELIKMTDKIM